MEVQGPPRGPRGEEEVGGRGGARIQAGADFEQEALIVHVPGAHGAVQHRLRVAGHLPQLHHLDIRLLPVSFASRSPQPILLHGLGAPFPCRLGLFKFHLLYVLDCCLDFSEQNLLMHYIRKAHAATMRAASGEWHRAADRVCTAAQWSRDPRVILSGKACKLSDQTRFRVKNSERRTR